MSLFDAFPPQDIFYGLFRSNLVLRLTQRNWKTKGIILISENGAWLYCWIRERTENGGTVYQVRLHTPVPTKGLEERTFSQVSDALAYLNGDDEGVISQKTRPALRREWPEDQAPASMISGIGAR
jgi:hypothetical protein